jgi:hypothetical protein
MQASQLSRVARIALGAALSAVTGLAGGCGQGGASAAANAAANTPGAVQTAASGTPTPGASTVPFVGCAQDGQGGPQPAPTGQPHAVPIDAASAAKLAYYSAGDPGGVLAPKGWYCFGVYGSDGAVLYVAPSPIQSADVLSDSWAAGSGPAVVAAFSSGDTSGRFAVAKAIARIFPSRAAFAQSVIAEGIEPATDFPSGPFPTDHDVVKSPTVVEYETPAGAQGLGTTFSRLAANASPIDGVAVLQGQTPDLAFLAVRLTPDLQPLTPAVVQLFETESAGPPQASARSLAAPTLAAPAAPDTSTPIRVVRAFYAALGNGDGATASSLVIPAKRVGNYAPAALTRYYGALLQPLQVTAIQQTAPGVVTVRYAYVAAGGRACNGAAIVHTVQAGGQALISAIQAPNGC